MAVPSVLDPNCHLPAAIVSIRTYGTAHAAVGVAIAIADVTQAGCAVVTTEFSRSVTRPAATGGSSSERVIESRAELLLLQAAHNMYARQDCCLRKEHAYQPALPEQQQHVRGLCALYGDQSSKRSGPKTRATSAIDVTPVLHSACPHPPRRGSADQRGRRLQPHQQIQIKVTVITIRLLLTLERYTSNKSALAWATRRIYGGSAGKPPHATPARVRPAGHPLWAHAPAAVMLVHAVGGAARPSAAAPGLVSERKFAIIQNAAAFCPWFSARSDIATAR
ncbi:hypothetical protein ON010_g10571 [Phytophthora cinnamomi]|nr:hypothetical protein ON010_g10571 [Phytophthora cinnamomi]